MPSHPLRQTLMDEVIAQIPPKHVGLMLMDSRTQTSLWVTHQGRVAILGDPIDVIDPAQVIRDGELRLTHLANLRSAELATLIDSFADPDHGMVVLASALSVATPGLPHYFKELLGNAPALSKRALERLNA